jgi:nucleotidyltransferase substrate binding protein (TIGR01987 family)
MCIQIEIMETKDIRWEQRFSNFRKALLKLSEGTDIQLDKITDLEKEGVIQRFEFTHELAWNVIKDYLEYQGNTSITGSRDATREAFKVGLVSNGEVWMDMIVSRNKTSHLYDENTANEIFEKVINQYYPLFLELKHKMESLTNSNV